MALTDLVCRIFATVGGIQTIVSKCIVTGMSNIQYNSSQFAQSKINISC